MPFVVTEFRGLVVVSVQQHLSHLGENAGNVGRLEGPLVGREQAFMTKHDLLGIRIASRFNRHRSIAGSEERIAGGDNTADAAPRHNLAADRRDVHVAAPFPQKWELRQIPVLLRAFEVIGRTNLLLCRLFDGHLCVDQRRGTGQPHGQRALLQKISALHRFLPGLFHRALVHLLVRLTYSNVMAYSRRGSSRTRQTPLDSATGIARAPV